MSTSTCFANSSGPTRTIRRSTIDRDAVTAAADRYAELKPQEGIQLLGAASIMIWGSRLEHESADTWPIAPRITAKRSETECVH